MTITAESGSLRCGEVRELLSPYLDLRLEGAQLNAVRTHLGDCSACADEKAALEQTDAIVAAALGDHPFGDAFVEELLGQLPAGSPGRTRPAQPSWERFRRPAGSGVAVAAALLLVGLGLQFGPREAQPVANLPAELEAPQVLGEAGSGLLAFSRDGSTRTLSAGDELCAGDRLLAVGTPEGGPSSFRLSDGSRVVLHADTELSLRAERDGGLTLALAPAEGKVFCDVAPSSRRGGAPFRVQASGLSVQVLGTRFLVGQEGGISSVTVVEGRVLATARAERRTLGPDDRAEVLTRVDTGRLDLTRVTARRRGLWVPRLALEQHELDRTAGAPAPPSSVSPARPVQRPAQGGPVDTGLDQPVEPPR